MSSALAGVLLLITWSYLVRALLTLLYSYHVFPLVSNEQPVGTYFTTIHIACSSSKLRLISSLGEDTLRPCRYAAPLTIAFSTQHAWMVFPESFSRDDSPTLALLRSYHLTVGILL